MRDAFLELLHLAERHVRGHGAEAERAQLLRDIAAFRRAVDFPDDRIVLHALEKFLYFCHGHAGAAVGLRSELEPFVEVALYARERLGGVSLLHVET